MSKNEKSMSKNEKYLIIYNDGRGSGVGQVRQLLVFKITIYPSMLGTGTVFFSSMSVCMYVCVYIRCCRFIFLY